MSSFVVLPPHKVLYTSSPPKKGSDNQSQSLRLRRLLGYSLYILLKMIDVVHSDTHCIIYGAAESNLNNFSCLDICNIKKKSLF
jgi:hypothetical protein